MNLLIARGRANAYDRIIVTTGMYRMNMQSGKKRQILDAAKELLLEVGYESMSPRKVLERSGAGQGSLYHHFSGKKQLTQTVLEEVAQELTDAFLAVFENENLSPVEKIDQYLARHRNGLVGCKLGRLSNEKAFCEDELRQPLQEFFNFALAEVQNQIELAVKDGSFPLETPSADIAHLILSAIQGGYVVSKATNNDGAVNISTQGARALLKAYQI